MSLQDSLFPFGGNHAIQNAVFVLEWTEPLPSAFFEKLREVVEPLKSEFPGPIQDQRRLTVNFSPGGHQVQTDEPGGFVLTRAGSAPSTNARSIVLGDQQCLIQIGDYTRWKHAKADVDRYLDLLFPEIATVRPIGVIGLQYVDVFNWKGDPAAMQVADVLRTDSKYLSSNVFAVNELWHSHHGYFDSYQQPREGKQLDNINVSRVETAGLSSIQILTSHRSQFRNPLWASDAEARSVFDVTFERMHDRNKAILADLLTEPVQQMIKLNYSV